MSERGRPSSYDPAYAKQAEKLCLLGATDEQLAEFFEVSSRTIYRWIAEFPDFCHALKDGKDVADQRVERSLYHKAVGYTHDAVKIFMPANATEPVYAPYKDHVAPDTTAMIFWLKNRQPAKWRDRLEPPVVINVSEISELEMATRIADLLMATEKKPPFKVIEGDKA